MNPGDRVQVTYDGCEGEGIVLAKITPVQLQMAANYNPVSVSTEQVYVVCTALEHQETNLHIFARCFLQPI